MLSHQLKGTGVHDYSTFLNSCSFNLGWFFLRTTIPVSRHMVKCVPSGNFPSLLLCGNAKKQRTGPVDKLTSRVTRPLLCLCVCWQELQFPDYKRWPGVNRALGSRAATHLGQGTCLSSRQEGAVPGKCLPHSQPQSLRNLSSIVKKT